MRIGFRNRAANPAFFSSDGVELGMAWACENGHGFHQNRWGSPELYRVTRWTGEVRKGGKWKSEGVSKEGKPFSVSGEFLGFAPGAPECERARRAG